jgi:hypothetical protein
MCPKCAPGGALTQVYAGPGASYPLHPELVTDAADLAGHLRGNPEYLG